MLHMFRLRTGLSTIARAAAVLLLLLFSALALNADSGNPASHIVVIRQMHFEPAQLSVKAGEIIVWKNEDIFAHTVTADDGSFDSGLIAPGQSWQTTIKSQGTIAYHCRPHPNMTASLQISAASESSTQNDSVAAHGSEPGETSLRFRPPVSPHEIHPILVNFTAALLPLAFLCDVLGLMFRRQSLHHAAWWMVLFEAAITPLTVLAGWWWKHSAGPDLPARLITVHQWLGSSAAVIFVILAVWRWTFYKRDIPPTIAYLVLTFVGVLALVYQGSLGGAMLFGN